MSSRDIWGFKLMNGFEIIGELQSINEHYYKVKNALGLAVFPEPTPENKENKVLKFIPFTNFQDLTDARHSGLDIELAKSNVLATYRPVQPIAKEYCDATSTIVVASSI